MFGSVKKVAGAVLISAMLIGSMGTVPAQAQSKDEPKPVIGKFDGVSQEAVGTIKYARTDAGTAIGIEAKTTFSISSYIETKGIVCYKVGKSQLTKSDTKSSSGGGATATVEADAKGAIVYGGKGVHFVRYNKYTWTDQTEIGDVWS